MYNFDISHLKLSACRAGYIFKLDTAGKTHGFFVIHGHFEHKAGLEAAEKTYPEIQCTDAQHNVCGDIIRDDTGNIFSIHIPETVSCDNVIISFSLTEKLPEEPAGSLQTSADFKPYIVFDLNLIEFHDSDMLKGIAYLSMGTKEKVIGSLKRNGLSFTAKKCLYRLFLPEKVHGKLKALQPDITELARQKKHIFEYNPVFSIVVPLYNTPAGFLREFLDSVISQSYKSWELCLADAGTSDEVCNIIKNEYSGEKRIKYKRLEKNLGISGNTNEAIKMSSGDFIAFSDHDDILSPEALYCFACKINECPEADIIYSDEDKLSSETKKLFQPHFKPDFNYDLLCTTNYICHIYVVKRTLIAHPSPSDASCSKSELCTKSGNTGLCSLGVISCPQSQCSIPDDSDALNVCTPTDGADALNVCTLTDGAGISDVSHEEFHCLLDDNFDGSQDYDFIFRTTEKAECICHIPKVLYHWRAHFASTANRPDSKWYAFRAGKRAIEAHYKRAGMPAEVLYTESIGIFRTKYCWPDRPPVSIIVYGSDNAAKLKKCITSLTEKNIYPDYEIIAIVNSDFPENTSFYASPGSYSSQKNRPVTSNAPSDDSVTGGTLADGTLANGTLADGTLANGTLADGTLAHGTLADGTLAHGTLADGTLAHGTLADGTLAHGTLADGTLAHGTLADGTLAHGMAAKGMAAGDAVTDGRMTDDMVTDDKTECINPAPGDVSPAVRIKYIKKKQNENIPAILNRAVKASCSDYCLLLNCSISFYNDSGASECISELLGYCRRDNTAVTGGLIYYEDMTVRHAGIIAGLYGSAGNAFMNNPPDETGYQALLMCAMDVSAVSAECMMLKKSVFKTTGGFDENYMYGFYDVDYCLKAIKSGQLVVYNPYARLMYHGRKTEKNSYHANPENAVSQALPDDKRTACKQNSAQKMRPINGKKVQSNIKMQLAKDEELFKARWAQLLADGDPFYNPNLPLDRADYSGWD